MVYDLDDVFWSQSFLHMQQRCEAQFGVDDAVLAQLAEHILGDVTKRIFGLHKFESLVRPRQEVSEIGAPGGGYKVSSVLLASDGRREVRNGLIAERDVHVQVQLDFGQGLQIHRNILAAWWRGVDQ